MRHMGEKNDYAVVTKYVHSDNSSNWMLTIGALFCMCLFVPSCYRAVRRLRRGIKYHIHSWLYGFYIGSMDFKS